MSRPPDHPGADARRYGATLQEFALRSTASLGAARSAADLEATLGRVKRELGHADEAAECPTCAECGVARVLVSELVPVVAFLRALPAEAIARLRGRADTYFEQTQPFRSGRLAESQASCPFQDGGACMLGPIKPFSGHVSPSGQVTRHEVAARALEFGHAAGLRLLGIDHHWVELGLAIPKILEDEDWPDRFLKGEPVFREEALFEPGPDTVIEYTKILTGREEANGFHAVSPDLSVDTLGEPALGKIRLPFAYRSDEDIDRHREEFSLNLRSLAATPYDPIKGFNALRRHNAFSFAYHDRDSKELLRDHSRLLIEPIVARAFPDLTQPIEGTKRSGRIKVGYLSENLRGHNGGAWAVHWIGNHGPEIESHVFATSANLTELSAEFFRVADHHYHMPGDVPYNARFIKSLGLDLLIFTDLGHHGANYQYAGMRLAPVQCTAWGSPITSGLSTIDYFLSSALMEPDNGDGHYTERLVRLPGTSQYFERVQLAPSEESREDLGLPPGFLAVMPQYLPKMAPRWDPLFARISQELQNPLIFFEAGDERVVRISKERFEKAGIRIQWMPWLERDRFYRVIEVCDLVLDPPAYNGGITTTEILSLRKPMVTLPGEFARSRFGLAFLTQANMTSLVARDADHYLELVKDRHAQDRAVQNANFAGPFEDRKAIEGLNQWLWSVARDLP